ncbi:hypothetical protein HGRIS_007310 [Hohenbuehelia grisea]|uniref:Uncharacterized protein n=1 Tax=Hohenbuehelia grisea TaxID=104357 RepID=A0ABR3J522_9AGAR
MHDSHDGDPDHLTVPWSLDEREPESLLPTLPGVEYEILVFREEFCRRMEHLEDLLNDMMTSSHCLEKYGHQILDRDVSGMLDDTEVLFIRRQLRRVSTGIEKRQPLILRDHGIQLQGMRELVHHSLFHGSSWTYGKALSNIAHATRACISSPLLQDHLVTMFNVAGIARDLRWSLDAAKLYRWLTGITLLLYRKNPSIESQRLVAVAACRTAQALLRLHDTDAIIFGDQAMSLWTNLYNHSGDPQDLFYVIQSISICEIACFRHGHLEESLDLSRQALLLVRSLPPSEAEGRDMVTWSASGEADVVFSARRRITQSLGYAWNEALCLWNLSKGLAFLGRYTEAGVAAVDAISCGQSCLSMLYQPEHQQSLALWRTESSSWVTVPPVLYAIYPYYPAPYDNTMRLGSMSNAVGPLAHKSDHVEPIVSPTYRVITLPVA